MNSFQKLFFFLNIFFFLHLACSFDADVVKTIDQVVGNFIELNKIAGYGLAIVKINEKGVPDFLTKGYGLRDLENKIKSDDRTLFAIGSITKSFTATVVVKTLSEKFPDLGEGALDTPIRVLLPSMNFTLNDRYRSESTTFRDLLSHRGCTNPGDYGFTLQAYKSKEEFLYRLRYAEEVCPFRTKFVYNNLAYFMAGEIIAQIANSTFEIMLADLLKELGMKDTIFIKDTDNYDNIPNMSRGYYRDDGELKRYNSSLLKWVSISPAPGGIISTAEDMLKYLTFHVNNGKIGSKQILKEDVIKYLRKSSIHLPVGPPSKNRSEDVPVGYTGYGLGFVIGLVDGWETIGHDGVLPPFSSYMSFQPALKLGIYSVSNGPILPSKIQLHKQIYEIIEKGKRKFDQMDVPKPTQSSNSTEASVKPCVDKKKVDIGSIIGVYGNGLEGEFSISQVNHSGDSFLYMSYGVWGTGNLRHLSGSSYDVKWDSDIVQLYNFLGLNSLTVDFGEKGKASIISPTGQKTIFQKDATLDKLPSQPWSDGSCGPTKPKL